MCIKLERIPGPKYSEYIMYCRGSKPNKIYYKTWHVGMYHKKSSTRTICRDIFDICTLFFVQFEICSMPRYERFSISDIVGRYNVCTRSSCVNSRRLEKEGLLNVAFEQRNGLQTHGNPLLCLP